MASYADIGAPGGGFGVRQLGPPDPFGTGGQNNLYNPLDFTGYYNQVPEAGYWNLLGQHNLLGVNNASRWAQQQFNRYWNMYQADAGRNLNEGFYDYYLRKGLDPNADYTQMDPTMRGDTSSRFLVPRARFAFGG